MANVFGMFLCFHHSLSHSRVSIPLQSLLLSIPFLLSLPALCAVVLTLPPSPLCGHFAQVEKAVARGVRARDALSRIQAARAASGAGGGGTAAGGKAAGGKVGGIGGGNGENGGSGSGSPFTGVFGSGAPPTAKKCDMCGAVLGRDPFHTMNFQFCSTQCLREHRRALAAAAAEKRFGGGAS